MTVAFVHTSLCNALITVPVDDSFCELVKGWLKKSWLEVTREWSYPLTKALQYCPHASYTFPFAWAAVYRPRTSGLYQHVNSTECCVDIQTPLSYLISTTRRAFCPISPFLTDDAVSSFRSKPCHGWSISSSAWRHGGLFQSQANPCGNYGEQSGAGTDFLRQLRFPRLNVPQH